MTHHHFPIATTHHDYSAAMTHHHHHSMPAASPAMTHGHHHSMPAASPAITHGHHHHHNNHHGHQQAAFPLFPVANPYNASSSTTQPQSVLPTTAGAPAVEPRQDDWMTTRTRGSNHHRNHHHGHQPAALAPGFLVAHPYNPSTTAWELPTTAVAPVAKPRSDDGCCAAFTITCVAVIVMVLGVILIVKLGLG